MNLSSRFRPYLSTILLLIVLASCAGRSGENTPALKLQVQPVPNVYVHYDSRSNIFRIGNELVERQISISPERCLTFTAAFTNKLSGRGYIRSLSKEFSFRANGLELSGVSGDFDYVNHKISGPGGVKNLEIKLRAMRKEIGLLELSLIYEIYPQTPVIRKWMEIQNAGGSSVTIDSIQVESLSLLPGSEYDLESYTRTPEGMAMLSPIVFDNRLMEGFWVGNEAPGVLKYYDLYSNRSFISIGMQPYSQRYATEIQLAPGESFISPEAFLLFFKGEPDKAVEILEKFIAEYITWSKTGLSNIWYESAPTDTRTESETRQKVQLAAESGADIFCIAGNWMDKRGDWNINQNAPLEKLAEYARESGMKFGLNINLAVADSDSQVIADYPEWIFESEDRSDYAIGDGNGAKLMCLGSEYTLYIVNQIDALVRELELDYIGLSGPIMPNGDANWCFAENHIHRSSAESLWYIYDGFLAICRRLHSQHPDLIVDVSTESYTPENVIDYALLKCADVEWPF